MTTQNQQAILDEAGNRLITADCQLDNYYGPDSGSAGDPHCLRQAEVNALVAIGHALTGILIELQNRSEPA